MKLLILGGTRFLGRHIARQAIDEGHVVTLLHRGRSGAGLFPEAEHCIGDRDGDLAAILGDGGPWDAAIDTSAYFPRQVRRAAAVLADRVGQYQLVSTISVYAAFDALATTEDAPLATLVDPEAATVTGETYGGLKALCEDAAFDAFDARCLVSRPGLLVGPHDPTGRYTWWPQRLQRAAADPAQAEVLAPGDPDAPVQYIDARDAAAWMLRQAEAASSGVFNLTGPEQPTTMGELLETLCTALAPAAHLRWVDEAFLLAQGVAPWTGLPLWLPRADAGLQRIDITRALATGLACRPAEVTAADTAAWAASAPLPPAEGPMRPRVGLTPEREAALLAAWAAHG